MKNKIILAILIAVSLIGTPASAHKEDISFEINNQQSESLGTVTVSTVDGDYYVGVQGNSDTTVSVSSTAISITINGQTIPQGVKALVTLPSSTVVGIIWVSPSMVEVIDKDILQ